jgi:hypothetical protein
VRRAGAIRPAGVARDGTSKRSPEPLRRPPQWPPPGTRFAGNARSAPRKCHRLPRSERGSRAQGQVPEPRIGNRAGASPLRVSGSARPRPGIAGTAPRGPRPLPAGHRDRRPPPEGAEQRDHTARRSSMVASPSADSRGEGPSSSAGNTSSRRRWRARCRRTFAAVELIPSSVAMASWDSS